MWEKPPTCFLRAPCWDHGRQKRLRRPGRNHSWSQVRTQTQTQMIRPSVGKPGWGGRMRWWAKNSDSFLLELKDLFDTKKSYKLDVLYPFKCFCVAAQIMVTWWQRLASPDLQLWDHISAPWVKLWGSRSIHVSLRRSCRTWLGIRRPESPWDFCPSDSKYGIR